MQAGHPLDLADHVTTDSVADLDDALAVPRHDVQVDGRLPLADLDRDTLGGRLGRAGDQCAELTDPAGHATTHGEDAGDVTGGQAGDLRHDRVGDPCAAR